MIGGRHLSEQKEKKVVDQSQMALEAERLEYVDKWGVKAVDDISFTLHKGEILGIAGVQGNGPVSYTHLDVYKRQIPFCCFHPASDIRDPS